MRRSKPEVGTSRCSTPPVALNQTRRRDASSAPARSSASSQRVTSRPQLPNRGFITRGGSSAGSGSQGATWSAGGCGIPADARASAVASLSCAVASVSRAFRTVTPRRSRRSSAHCPGSTVSQSNNDSVPMISAVPRWKRRDSVQGFSLRAIDTSLRTHLMS